MTFLSTFNSLPFLCNLSQFHCSFYNLPLTLGKALTFSSLHNYNSSSITSHQEALLTLLHPIGYCQVYLLNTTLNMSLPIQKNFQWLLHAYSGSIQGPSEFGFQSTFMSPNDLIKPFASPIWFTHSPPKPHYLPNPQHTSHQGSQTC